MQILEQLRGGLVVSCQPVDGGAMDHPEIVAAMASAAVAGGAAGLRIEGIANLTASRPLVRVPIIGIVKYDCSQSLVRITPRLSDVAALLQAGADVIAYDATDRTRTDPRAEIVAAIVAAGALAMADCSTIEDAQRALSEGATILGSTLSGYTAETASDSLQPDFALLKQLSDTGAFVMAEGRYNTPALAAQALRSGADAVTVGSALTRLEHITGWFATAIAGAK